MGSDDPNTHKIYVIGGYDGSNVSSTVQIYDVAADSWSVGASMPTPRSNLLAGFCGDLIHAIGGFDGTSELDVNEAYDVISDTWTTGFTPLPEPRSEFMTQGISTGQDIYAIGDGIHGVGGAPHDVYTCSTCLGDRNSDGAVNLFDVVIVVGGWRDPSPDPRADVNNDGSVNVQDIMLVASHYGELCE